MKDIEENGGEISRRAKLVRGMVAEFNKNNFLKNHFVAEVRGVSEINKSYKYPEQYNVSRIELENFPMEMIKNTEADSDLMILQLHGGGYVGAFKNNYRNMARFYSESGNGAGVLTIDYRVAPDNPYPAALEDSMAAYEWLLAQGYNENNIIFAGDSAGGGLALALCLRLRDEGRKLPKGIICFSPWTDLTAGGDSYRDNADIDPIFGHSQDDIINDSAYIGDDDPENPYISPIFGELDGFPPMLIQVGTREMLLSDSLGIADKARKAGVNVTLSVYEGMFHVFQMVGNLVPESKKAWDEVKTFIQNL